MLRAACSSSQGAFSDKVVKVDGEDCGDTAEGEDQQAIAQEKFNSLVKAKEANYKLIAQGMLASIFSKASAELREDADEEKPTMAPRPGLALA